MTFIAWTSLAIAIVGFLYWAGVTVKWGRLVAKLVRARSDDDVAGAAHQLGSYRSSAAVRALPALVLAGAAAGIANALSQSL